MTVRPIPTGYHSITPYLIVRDPREAIEFYKRAFGAELHLMMDAPDGSVIHAEIKIGDSIIMMSREQADCATVSPESLGKTTALIHLYVKDADAAFRQAIATGASELMKPADMFWGDRYGKVVDPFGHQWSISQHIEDLTQAEIKQRAQQFFTRMAASKG